MIDGVSEVPMTEKGNLACPFCGGVQLSRIQYKSDVSWVQCENCGATGPNLNPEIGWNVRAFTEAVYLRTKDIEQFVLTAKDKELLKRLGLDNG